MEFTAVIIILLGAAAAVVACRGLDARERRYAMIAFAAHVLMSFVHWGLEEFFYQRVSDAYSYLAIGAGFARLLDSDFVRYAPELARYALHLDNTLPFEMTASGTGTMSAIAGFIVFLVGPSLLSVSLFTTWLSWFGQLCFYRVAREELDPVDHKAALIGLLYVPSVIFWVSGFAKESFTLGFLGILTYSTYRAWHARSLLHLGGVVMGGVGVAMVKPYTLFPFVLGVAAFIYADRAWRDGGPVRIRPAYLVLALALAVGGVAALGNLFPELGAEKVAETLSKQQVDWRGTEGGSNIEMVGGDERTLAQQLEFVPLALANSFFRPFVFEAKNGPALAASLETTLLTLGLIALVGSRHRRLALDQLFRSPLLVFGAVFVVVLAVAVGLTTSNLGSLSRYRVPMMPFYALILLVLRRRIKDAEAQSVVLARPLVGGRSRTA